MSPLYDTKGGAFEDSHQSLVINGVSRVEEESPVSSTEDLEPCCREGVSQPKRRRASKACLRCRARKVRCDLTVNSGRPCTNCALDRKDCIVSQRQPGRKVRGVLLSKRLSHYNGGSELLHHDSLEAREHDSPSQTSEMSTLGNPTDRDGCEYAGPNDGRASYTRSYRPPTPDSTPSATSSEHFENHSGLQDVIKCRTAAPLLLFEWKEAMQAHPLQQFYHSIERFRDCANHVNSEEYSVDEAAWRETLRLTLQAIKSVAFAKASLRAVDARLAYHCRATSKRRRESSTPPSHPTVEAQPSQETQQAATTKQQCSDQEQISRPDCVLIPAYDTSDEPPWDDYIVNLG